MRGKPKDDMIKELRAQMQIIMLQKRNVEYVNMYDKGRLEGLRLTVLQVLLWLDPDYRVEKDTPMECLSTGCHEVFFPSRNDRLYHTKNCRQLHQAHKRRAEELGVTVQELVDGIKSKRWRYKGGTKRALKR
jgi:hypothetical protein